jgi:hypothetical protein
MNMLLWVGEGQISPPILPRFTRGGGGTNMPPPLTPDLSDEGTAFPIYLILKVKQD